MQATDVERRSAKGCSLSTPTACGERSRTVETTTTPLVIPPTSCKDCQFGISKLGGPVPPVNSGESGERLWSLRTYSICEALRFLAYIITHIVGEVNEVSQAAKLLTNDRNCSILVVSYNARRRLV